MIKLQDHREVFQATIWGRIIYTQKYYGFAFALFRYALHVMQLQQLQLLPSCSLRQLLLRGLLLYGYIHDYGKMPNEHILIASFIYALIIISTLYTNSNKSRKR